MTMYPLKREMLAVAAALRVPLPVQGEQPAISAHTAFALPRAARI
jgi:hypothetical protein